MKQACDILSNVEKTRKIFNGANSREKRSENGQFLTPAPIASFMASLFDRSAGDLRVLDAGAGAGSLFAALVDELRSRTDRPKSISITTYENDAKLLPYLDKAINLCRAACSESEMAFNGVILNENFISSILSQTESSLFEKSMPKYTHVILNPPYKKINSQSSLRKRLNSAGFETSNLYSAFVWLAASLLEPGGEIVAIIPRSFCNGPYFKRFRKSLLTMIDLQQVHIFKSRKEAFADDSVLQENLIIHGIKGKEHSKHITISITKGLDFKNAVQREIARERVIIPGDSDVFIHLVDDDEGQRAMDWMSQFQTSLAKLGLEVSTGRVVDFRAFQYLRYSTTAETVPLIHPFNFKNGFVSWPVINRKKPNAILMCNETRDLMIKSKYYVLTKRFSSNEQRRRIVSAVFDPARISAQFVGLENHLNYFHAIGDGMHPDLAKGLSAFLNCSQLDRYFRVFSGHTQVNATDLRKLFYPFKEQLKKIGRRIGDSMPDQMTIDSILEEECDKDGKKDKHS
jgi:adenine-specific DNA-methyltransferase